MGIHHVHGRRRGERRSIHRYDRRDRPARRRASLPRTRYTRLDPLAAGPRSHFANLHAQWPRREADHRGRYAHQRTICMTLLPLLLALEFGESDPDLAERLKRREPQAMADLYDRYGRLAYSLIVRIVRDAQMAEDLVQETFIRVWSRVQAFDSQRGALGPWLLAVARNRAIDYLRSVDGRMARSSFELVEMENPALFANLETQIVVSDQASRI